MGKQRGTTKSGGQKHELDKFYTKPEVAAYFISKSSLKSFTTIIEPSAGSGSFANQINGCVAFDLAPESPNIIKQNWLDYNHSPVAGEKVLVIGNPPFGQQNNLALKFINHAAKFAHQIAFILPVSFKKESIQNRIDPQLHLIYQEDVPENSFTLNGQDYNVRCVFQVWERVENKRIIPVREALKENNLFRYVSKDDSPDAAIQRIGGRAGFATVNHESRSASSNYFVQFLIPHNGADLETVIRELNAIDYESRDYAVGPRSISKVELNKEINLRFSK